MTPRNATAANEAPPGAGDELSRLQAENAGLRQSMAELEMRVAELEILADRDPLTTVLNRRAFMRELHRVIGYCHR
jgi:GGDEF domain-containing protein